MRDSASASPRPSATTQRLLDGPILPTLAMLCAPNLAMVAIQIGTTTMETYFVGRLGTDALAGLALVLPLLMLMNMMAAGAMGGGISSAVARALGGGRRDEAESLAFHALIVALFLGAAFTLIVWLFGRALFQAMGGVGAALAEALSYAYILFGAAMFHWIMNGLASVLRGTGNMAVPAGVIMVTMVGSTALAPLLMFGVGPIPALGMAGAAAAQAIGYSAGAAFTAWHLVSGRAIVRLRLRGIPLSTRRIADILRVGLPAVTHALMINLSVIAVNSYVAAFGTAALAGYGVGARLEYFQISLAFCFGAGLVAMVGTNFGAGQYRRARRVALLGGLCGFLLSGAVGVAVALAPDLWTRLFTADPEALAAGAAYLRRAGWAYGAVGLGMALYFAAQGSGRMTWPLIAGSTRLLILAGGGWLVATSMSATVEAVFLIVALGLLTFGAINLVGTFFTYRPRAMP
ncbi:MAG: MATE family efflux transporter [Alphaproteobacteria bacterium]|nr:MATE family efflux transporter [Alphaproteobacteria bacterium]